MSDAVKEALKWAVRRALRDLDKLQELPRDTVHDVLPKEMQPQCSMFAFFRQQGCIAHAEAAYPRRRGECDLRVRFPDGAELWIEIKNTWWVSGYDNSATEAWANWVGDLRKLRCSPGRALRAFVLFGYFDHSPMTSKRSVPQAVRRFHPDALVYGSEPKKFRWRRSSITTLQAWAWAFSADELRHALAAE
jgi:hypothetical protein